MIVHSSQGVRESTFVGATNQASAPACASCAQRGAGHADPPAWSSPTPLPRNTPRSSVPGVTARVIGLVGVGIVPKGFEDQYAELHALMCETCGGSGLQPGEPQPDADGNFTACGPCEGTGVKDPH